MASFKNKRKQKMINKHVINLYDFYLRKGFIYNIYKNDSLQELKRKRNFPCSRAPNTSFEQWLIERLLKYSWSDKIL